MRQTAQCWVILLVEAIFFKVLIYIQIVNEKKKKKLWIFENQMLNKIVCDFIKNSYRYERKRGPQKAKVVAIVYAMNNSM